MAIDKREDDSFSSWSREQNKAFENAIAAYSEKTDSNWWEKIAESVPGKSLQEIKEHYQLLISDLSDIESGLVPLPSYSSSSDGSSNMKNEGIGGKKGGQFGNFDVEANSGRRGFRSEQERRKGIAWTEEEHRLFLLGLEKFGKGDWRSISRTYVMTRTPTQVASHAQKYFIRLNSENKERRRSSIHDITNINNDRNAPQGPITGQTNSKPPNQTLPPVMGQPIGPAVGTPVPPPSAHMAYGVRAPIQGPMVQGSHMNVGHMTYPTPRR